MKLIFYGFALVFAIIAAPLYVLVRTYYGWLFGFMMLIAWLISLALMPGGIAALETLIGPVITPYYAPVVLWFQAAQWFGFGGELFYGIWQPALGKWIYLAGMAVWPVHLAAMLIGRFNNLPPGRIGVGFSNRGLLYLVVLVLPALIASYVWFDPKVLEALVPALPVMAGCGVLALLGGSHERMLILDNPVSDLFAIQKSSRSESVVTPSTVTHGALGAGVRKGGLDAVFSRRTEGLARLADG